MAGEDARPEGEQPWRERVGRALGRWIWVWPPLLTLLLALGVTAWGVRFGAAAIAVLGAGIVGLIAYAASARHSSLWALALGLAAGILLLLLCTQQSAIVFGTPATAGASSTPTPTSTKSPNDIICTGAVERNLSGESRVTVTGSITGLPGAAQVTTIVTSDGATLASEHSFPNGEGVANLDLAIQPAPAGAVEARTEVRIGPEVVQTCQW